MIVYLSQGLTTEIDDADWEKLKDYKWFAHVRPKRTYAVSSSIKGQTLYMHRLIMSPPRGMQVDHIDGDGLNNKRSNLRLATSQQNNANAFRTQNVSGYIGVNITPSGRWQARARKGGTRHHIGVFDTPEEAARAYDAWTFVEYGDFAQLNFPEGQPDDDSTSS